MSIRNGALKERSQKLRNNATKEENHLWYDFLKTYPVQFRRQLPFERFILDFYCAKARLCIEIDGQGHFTEQGKAYDEERSAMLKKYSIYTVRFSNSEVRDDFDKVCSEIDSLVKTRIKTIEKMKSVIE